MAKRRSATRPPGAGNAASTTATSTSTSNKTVEYDVALASASATPAAIMRPGSTPRSPARSTHQTASATRNSDKALYVANAPRCRVGPSTANNAAAKNAARRPYRRRAALHSSLVAPSMKTRDRTRAPASPPA